MPASPSSNFSFRKALPWLLAVIVVGSSTAAAWYFCPTAKFGSGVMAKTLCSGVFVSHRAPEDIRGTDLSGPPYEDLKYFQWKVDRDAKRVVASAVGLGAQTAIFREGLGCTLLGDGTEDDLHAQSPGLPPATASNPEALWPEGERVDLDAIPPVVDRAELEKGVNAAFAEVDEKHPRRRTRALVVVYDGRIVAERYAPGFDAKMPLLGWSMAKTATNALVGLRVQDGKLATTNRELLPEWKSDARSEITLDELLRMTSGLSFKEDYGLEGDAGKMLFVESDKSGYAAAKKPLAHPPGTYWDYSSGTTNILARVLRRTFADEQEYLRYPRERLFEPLGMRSAVFEPDAAGIFIGSSYLYATARDWARLGLLFLQDGVWQGKRLLPEGWVAYTVTPVREASNERYGAQAWLKLDQGPAGNSPDLGEPPLPEDAYYMLGHDGQTVAVVPSRNLVIVRLGLTRDECAWDPAGVFAPIVRAFPPRT